MNESERAELEQLKQRLAQLQGQVSWMGRALEGFETRLRQSAQTADPSEPAQPQAAAPAPVPEQPKTPQPAPRPAVPVPKPPVIPTPAPLVFVQAQAKPVQPPPPPSQPREISTRPPAATPQAREGASFEMRLGTYWLVRIGIVMLLTGLVFFGVYAYENFIPKLGPAGKVSLLYLASGALLGVGAWLQRKEEKLRNYAQVLLAGGLAAVYFTTYAAHHVPNLRVIGSALLDGGLLLGWAGFVVWLADRKKSEVLALFAVLLAYYSSIMTQVAMFTLYSNLVLALTAVFFMVRNRWAALSFASLPATYASYAFWRFYESQNGHLQWASPEQGLWTGICFLIAYWIIFTAALFLSKHEQFAGGRRATFLSLNNGAFFTAFLLTMIQVRQGGFWKFSLIYGSVLIGLAGLARRLKAEDKLFCNTYLTEGLLLVTLGFVTHFTGLRLSLILATESVALAVLGQQVRNRVMQVASCIAGALAVGLCLLNFANQVHMLALAQRTGWPQGALVGALMLANALWVRRFAPSTPTRTFHPQVTFFSSLTLIAWLGVTCVFIPADYLAPALAVEAVLFTASFFVFRLTEIALFGQAFLIIGQLSWMVGSVAGHPEHLWWNPATVIAVTLALSAWWQRQRVVKVHVEIQQLMQGLHALAVVGLLYFWLEPRFDAADWLAFVSVLALVLTAYGVLTRYWLLAAAGQIFVVISGWEFLRQLLGGKPAWYLPLAPVVILVLLAGGTTNWFKRRPDANPAVSRPLLNVSLIYRVAAVVMALWWVHKYIDPREQCWVFSLIGLALFLLSGWRRNQELLIFSALFTLTGVIHFWLPPDSVPTLYWPNLLALLLLPVQQRLAKHWPNRYGFQPQIHAAIMVLGSLSLWRFLDSWVMMLADGFYLTASWSVLALVLFVAGMALRERVYRWVGLGVLACALGRVMIVDIWRLQRIYQILSFMALGIVLLVLGFIYNKYQERIKEWL